MSAFYVTGPRPLHLLFFIYVLSHCYQQSEFFEIAFNVEALIGLPQLSVSSYFRFVGVSKAVVNISHLQSTYSHIIIIIIMLVNNNYHLYQRTYKTFSVHYHAFINRFTNLNLILS